MSVVPIPPAKAVPAENGWLTPDHVPGRVSVVVPTHNRARLLGVALDSVEGQTLREGEIVVVDDGSTDDTLAVLEARAAPPAGWTMRRAGSERGSARAREKRDLARDRSGGHGVAVTRRRRKRRWEWGAGSVTVTGWPSRPGSVAMGSQESAASSELASTI